MQVGLAATLLVFSALFATVESVILRMVGDIASQGQVLLFRSGGQVVVALALGGAFTGAGAAMVRTTRLRAHLWRGSLAAISWWCYYMNFKSLDLALATTLTFTSQLFLLVLAAFIAGERITTGRAVATFVGFAGVVVAAGLWNPGTADWRIVYGLTNAFLGAVMILITRSLSQTDRTETIMLYMAGVVLLSSIPQAMVDWRPLTSGHLTILITMGLLGTTSTFLMVEAYRRAETSALAPYPYSRLIFAAALGAWVFGDRIATATVVGALLIIASNLQPLLERRARRAG
jgi:drug/metabolite transporter (DMT)-like permease